VTTVGEHYRPADTDHQPGVYRVVGGGDPVALLRVADGEGRRVHGGELLRLPAEAIGELEPAADPDAGVAPMRALGNALSGLYWSVRRFLP